MQQAHAPYSQKNKIRIVTAASLFDGHDAAINVMRRILQRSGAEIIHLGHNRSVDEIVSAAIQEDAQGIAISSYQGGHIEYFKYAYDMLQERGAGHIRIFGGGGGVIVPREIDELQAYGICRIFSPEDGRRIGLQGMINEVLQGSDFSTLPASPDTLLEQLNPKQSNAVAQAITLAEHYHNEQPETLQPIMDAIAQRAAQSKAPVIGITGTGGAGKSSLCDELLRRFLLNNPDKHIGIICVDPSKRKTGGALLGDRIRYNSLELGNAYLRSLATRDSHSELSAATTDAIQVLKAAGFDLILIESSGIGQADTAIVDICDLPIYVMTSEYGAASQLEKINMLDYADMIVINKFDRKGSLDALRDVRKQIHRNHDLPADAALDTLPVYGTMAANFNDEGIHTLYHDMVTLLKEKTGVEFHSPYDNTIKVTTGRGAAIPPKRIDYLGKITDSVRSYKAWAKRQADIASTQYCLHTAIDTLAKESKSSLDLEQAAQHISLDPNCQHLLDAWPAIQEQYAQDEFRYKVRNKEICVDLKTVSLSGSKISKIALPQFRDWGDLLEFRLLENLPGSFPYTAGIFPFKRQGEDPKRMFAGEGPPERTNKRFHLLCEHEPAKRLSTAFDSATLYGEDPHERPDIFGKIGESGVSICTLDDMKKLFAGFDLCAPNTSVSKTINGPAPIILAMFLNTAIDFEIEKFATENKRQPSNTEQEAIRTHCLHTIRGTVQADILKEDQAQNTCIFSTEFALKMMGDIQEFFIQNKVRNYYSVSISGYHIAEAGANPISQMAFTLANGFTYVEYYLSRGFHIDDFAPSLSFFFSNGLDPEYTVIGRVARRIWAIAMKHLYGGNASSQKLKYHIQTSGRSLHAQEIQFNDIRTTLQALLALFDNCNSLHTNAYDEAITTPTEESVRRAMAIQLIINREFGWAKNENPLQGSYITQELTELVEEAVLDEFTRLNERGGVLGAMERQYQRSKIQEESLHYEHLKHSGTLPIIGVNCYQNPESLKENYRPPEIELRRASYEEKQTQLNNLLSFQKRHQNESAAALKNLQHVAANNGNIFAELMHTVRRASLGQIVNALYEVGGKYRRNL